MSAAALILPDGTELDLEAALLIGRSADNDLVLHHNAVSRHHARVAPSAHRWFVEDRGSFHGTFVNGIRLHPHVPHPLRHADRVTIAGQDIVFVHRGKADADETGALDSEHIALTRPLSAFQRSVVAALCEHWLAGGSLNELPSNAEIAARLGTPGATESVKAALRRAYAKAALDDEPAARKRRALCLAARRHGWV